MLRAFGQPFATSRNKIQQYWDGCCAECCDRLAGALNEHCDLHFLMHEFKLHKVIYNISQFEKKLKILLKTYFDFNTVKNISLGCAGYVRTQ